MGKDRRENWVVLGIFLLTGAASGLRAQTTCSPNLTPCIQSLQSGFVDNPATNGAAITAGTPVDSIWLTINGAFSPFNSVETITWTSQTQGAFTLNLATDPTNTQLVASVPASLFAAPDTVSVTVTEISNGSMPPSSLSRSAVRPQVSVTSNAATFIVNPRLGPPAGGQLLPPATVGVAYSQPFFSGGTAPFTVTPGAVPPGFVAPESGNLLTGMPTAANAPNPATFTPVVVDAWGNRISLNESILIVAMPTVTGQSASSVGVGAPGFNLGLTGANFTPPLLGLSGNAPGSTVHWQMGSSEPISLATTVTDANDLIAAVPASLLTVTGTAIITVVQPGGATSNAVQFSVLSPVIQTITPASVTVGSAGFTLTVNGANYVVGGPLGASQVVFGGAALNTAFVNSGKLTAAVPAQTKTGAVQVSVSNPGGFPSNSVTLQVLPAPSITSLSPASAIAGGPAFALQVNGAGFTDSQQVLWNGNPLSTGFVSANQLTAAVPASLIQGAGSAQVAIRTSDGVTSGPAAFAIVTKPQILTTGLPSGTVGASYDARLAASGGTPPYAWSAAGLPAPLAINRSTGEITGVPGSSGAFPVTITVTDSANQTASAAFMISIGPSTPPAVQITTGSVLPPGTVGTQYSFVISAVGGAGSYTFTQTGGSLPPGVQLGSGGGLFGAPTTTGQFSFSVQASDGQGGTASGSFSITINPAPLTITTGALSAISAGATIAIKFAASGGAPPYTFSIAGSTPPGAIFTTDGALTGTATSIGSYTFQVTATDSAKTTASKSFTLQVTPAALTISTSLLPSGQVGTPYSATISATGGAPPYNWSALGVSGLAFFSSATNATLAGTPTTAGTFSIPVTVTDTAGAKASATLSLTINPPGLTVITASLPNGALNTAYSANLNASGGTAPYAWSFTGLPAGLSGSPAGAITGTPTAAGTFNVTAKVTDASGAAASATFSLTILAAPLTITTASVSPVAVGSPFSVDFGANGGVPPYTWKATGLPAGISFSAGGTLSGAPTSPGDSPIVITVTDSTGTTVSETLTFSAVLPSAPTLTLSGFPATGSPATQPSSSITLDASYPVDITVNLTLTFAPLSGADDPNIQFATGGRTAQITIKAGSTASATNVAIQTGTVAGTITITAQLFAAGQNITPTPPPTRTIVIPPSAPAIASVTAVRNATGFTVTVIGYSTTRSVTQAVFQFTAAAGSSVQTTSVTIPATTIFTTWYQNSSSAQYGSQFSFTQPFTVQGSAQSIASVSVTLTNANGSSSAASASLQ
jgi:hypothetical protein